MTLNSKQFAVQEGTAQEPQGRFVTPPSGSLEGTTKNPQGRLFGTTGMHAGDPWAMHPDNWVAGKSNRGHDVIAWHASDKQSLPRHDNAEDEQRPRQMEDVESDHYSDDDDEDDYHDYDTYTEQAVDEKDRPMMDYGSGVGMHFGTLQSAQDRGSSRPYIHPARLPGPTMTPANYKSRNRDGRSFDENGEQAPENGNWSDHDANYSGRGTDIVENGGTIPYTNTGEDIGSTSWRTLPETSRTWNNDITESSGKYQSYDENNVRGAVHPALKHVADMGYNPVIKQEQIRNETWAKGGAQQQLPGFKYWYPESGPSAGTASDHIKTGGAMGGPQWSWARKSNWD